jgi:Xaa-Pro aminopeptidase
MSVVDLSFSVEEFRDRLKRTRQMMAKRNIELLILDEIEAMTWISGYGLSETMWRAIAIPQEGEPFMMIRSLDILPARERSWFTDIVGFKDWEDPVEIFVAELRKRNWHGMRLGLDHLSQSMPIGRFRQLQTLLGSPEIADFGKGIWELRWIKSPAEIGYLRKAAAVADAAILAAVKATRVGGRQRDVIKAAANTYLDLGADDGFVGPLTSGSSWDSLHGHEHVHELRRGDIVHIELVPRVREYSSRIMRSCVVGEPTAKQLDVMKELKAIQDAQLAAMRPGVEARQIDAMVREPLIKSGLRPHYENITGYTLGFYPTSTQHISDFTHIFTPKADWPLQKGMTLHMYASASGLALSESVLVTDNGVERLTKSERKLFATG